MAVLLKHGGPSPIWNGGATADLPVAGTNGAVAPYISPDGGGNGHELDGTGELPGRSPGALLPERRCRRRPRTPHLRHVPGPGALPRVRPRAAHRPRRLGRRLRTGAAPDPQAPPHGGGRGDGDTLRHP